MQFSAAKRQQTGGEVAHSPHAEQLHIEPGTNAVSWQNPGLPEQRPEDQEQQRGKGCGQCNPDSS